MNFDFLCPMILFSQLILCFVLWALSFFVFIVLCLNNENIYMKVFSGCTAILSVLWFALIFYARTTDWYPPPEKIYDVVITITHISTLLILLYAIIVILNYVSVKNIYKKRIKNGNALDKKIK